jgi:hypothetical protein
VAEILLLAVGRDTVLDDIGAAAVRTGDDFDNHALTLAHCSIIRVWHTTPLRWSKYFSGEQMLVLKSEDLFERTQETLELVLNFLDLPKWEPEALEMHNKGNYKREMNLSASSGWKNTLSRATRGSTSTWAWISVGRCLSTASHVKR